MYDVYHVLCKRGGGGVSHTAEEHTALQRTATVTPPPPATSQPPRSDPRPTMMHYYLFLCIFLRGSKPVLAHALYRSPRGTATKTRCSGGARVHISDDVSCSRLAFCTRVENRILSRSECRSYGIRNMLLLLL